MCKILLSINPEHIENIFNGTKQYEYRKTRCSRQVDKIIFYSTSPVKKVVGEADVKTTLIDNPSKVWQRTKHLSGINYDFFKQYYANKNEAVAYKLFNVRQYSEPRELSDYGCSAPPQSFMYLK